MTLHGAFGNFKFGNEHLPLNDEKRANLRESLSELKLIIVDEMSLVDADMMYKIDLRLKEIFPLNNDIPFGGISIIWVGDLLQIPPVTYGKELRYIFSCPKNQDFSGYHQDYPHWELFEPMVLRENHRQGDCKDWAETLNRFRLGIVTEEDLKLLQDRETDDPHLDKDSMHICFTNQEVADHNDKMINSLPSELISAESIKRYPKTSRKPKIKNDGRIEGSRLLDILNFKIDARSAMIFNVNTIDGLVNGASGTIVGVEYKNKSVDCIINKFDSESCGENQRMKFPNLTEKYKAVNGTPVFRQEIDISLSSRGDGPSAKVLQFPLAINYASTAHRMQVRLYMYFLKSSP